MQLESGKRMMVVDKGRLREKLGTLSQLEIDFPEFLIEPEQHTDLKSLKITIQVGIYGSSGDGMCCHKAGVSAHPRQCNGRGTACYGMCSLNSSRAMAMERA